MDTQEKIRNFCIISHIDHGKSTLADRLLEKTHSVEKRKMKDQFLDQMDLERQHGITIKLQPVRMIYELPDDLRQVYQFRYCILNLIDTPGHVDFTYEVSRSLAACEGAILIIDATQGIEAQTLTNVYMALEQNLVIIPVINKIDLPNAEPNRVADEVESVLKISQKEMIFISAKLGTNVDEVLREVVKRVPAPQGHLDSPLRALVFDSVYDRYKGVIAYIRVVDGSLEKTESLELISNHVKTEALELGFLKPQLSENNKLKAGEIGYIATGLKEVSQCRVGDTITKYPNCEIKPLSGYKAIKPIVFADIFPSDNDDFALLKDALEKLKLNDASLFFEPARSEGLGVGFRSGFLGLLHLEIIKERLENEYKLDLIITTPSVSYKVQKIDDQEIIINSPSDLPEPQQIKQIKEPWVKAEIISPKKYLGNVMGLVQERRGSYKETKYIDTDRILLIYEMPLSEIISAFGSKNNFYDQLKSASSGYASLSYDFIEFQEAKLIKLDILIAGDKVDAMSQIIYEDDAYRAGRYLVKKLKENLPKQLFAVSLQAVINNKIIARETMPALRKDVTAKLYGGDYTRKSKLLQKQKKGKKKMKSLGKVTVPSETLFKIIKS